MAKAVKGYMSDDDMFFHTAPEADRHNAEIVIRAHCVEHRPAPVNAEKFLALIEALADPIMEYLRANQKVNTVTEDTSGFDRDQSDDGRRSEDADALEQFEVSGHEPVPDMGDSSSGETIPVRGKKHGPRGRRDDA